MKKVIWIRADGAKNAAERKKLVTTALENNFTNIIIKDDDEKDFQKLGKFNHIRLKKGKIMMNDKTGELLEIKSRADQDRAMKLAGTIDFIIISAKDWKVIPFENLIAAYQRTKTKLLAEVKDAAEAKLLLQTLEVGVDGVVLNTKSFKKILELRKFADKLELKKMELVSAKITKIESLGMGDRVCIDTCSMLGVGEGMLIGSSANGLFLVHSESMEAEYVAARPFRVNAGPVHSYILSTGDKTKYLSDLKVGDEVLVVDKTGAARPVLLGRLKIERRPLILIEVKVKNEKFNIILQNAETIRLVSNNKPVSIVDLAVGDAVLMWLGTGTKGRHFGMIVDEKIIEK
ncbi:3-dehydroquinate synthase II [[Eubacterium] cellulosolvens]